MSKAASGEPPKRRNWVSPLALDAAAAGQTAILRAGFADPSLVLHWEAIAGAETARLARPFRFAEGPHGGVLTLLAEPGAAVFLQHDSRALCERINLYLGRLAVTRLKFVQAALSRYPLPPPRRPQPGPLPQDDPAQRYQGPEGLREALQKLARARRVRTRTADADAHGGADAHCGREVDTTSPVKDGDTHGS